MRFLADVHHAVPEPSSLVLLGITVLGLPTFLRGRRTAPAKWQRMLARPGQKSFGILCRALDRIFVLLYGHGSLPVEDWRRGA
jgi:hypothetical protein